MTLQKGASVFFCFFFFIANQLLFFSVSLEELPLRTTAEVHHHDTTEDHEGGKYLLPTKSVHAEADADGGGNDGLYVGVHADQGRTDTLLTYRDEEVGDKGGTNDEVSQLRKVCSRECAVIESEDFLACKREREEG